MLLAFFAAEGCSTEEAVSTSLPGTWVSHCDVGSSSSEKTILVLGADGSLIQKEDTYTSMDCSGSVASTETQYTGSYVVGSDTPAMAGVKNLDLHLTVTSSGQSYIYYTIFKLDGDVLTRGGISSMYDGFTENARHVVLSTDEDDIFDRQ